MDSWAPERFQDVILAKLYLCVFFSTDEREKKAWNLLIDAKNVSVLTLLMISDWSIPKPAGAEISENKS